MTKAVKRFLLIAGYPDSLVNFREALLHALIAEGLEVHVAAPGLIGNGAIRRRLESIGVKLHDVNLNRTGTNPLADIQTTYSLWRLMHRIKPDYSLGYTIKPVVYGSIAAWLAAVPSRFAMITGLGYAFIGESGQRTWLKRIVQVLYRTALGRVHKVFFQNPDDEALFYDLDIIKPVQDKAFVVNGSGINIASFRAVSLPTGVSFLLIARLLGDKGVREYVKAAAVVRQQFPDIRFSLVGWIDNNPDAITESELQNWIDSGDITFYGRLDDVKTAIAECSVYVLPSYREGTPRTVLEAMAMARPIITSDAPGCRETVVDGDNGFLVPVKSVDQLVDAMLKFIEEPHLISQMGERSRQIAEEKYDVEKVNEHMLAAMGIK